MIMRFSTMATVSKEHFDAFMKNKIVERVQGESFHSDYYVDENGDAIAYVETSSWSQNVQYRIKAEYTTNTETIDIVTKMIKLWE